MSLVVDAHYGGNMKRRLSQVLLAGTMLCASLVSALPSAQAMGSPWVATKSSRAFGGQHFIASVTGATAVFTVKGPTFALWYTATKTSGKAAIFVNGKRVRTLDQYSPRTVRRSSVFTRTAKVNRVTIIVLATRNKASKGRRIIVDAFSTTPSKCGSTCNKNPVPINNLGEVAEAGLSPEWYPSAVPARTDARWTIAVGSYVRGRDVYPIDTAVPVIRSAACDQARKVPRGVVVLSFGMQIAGGAANGFGKSITREQMIATASAWATGLAECASGPWEVSIGTSNSGGVTRYNGYLGGKAWAKLVDDARAASDPRTVVSGAVDLEPGWGPPGQARAWVDGYVDNTKSRLWNFGSADGCPQTISTDLTCNNGWTIDDVLWVSSHAGPSVLAMPQIHTQSGSQSRQWAVLAARGVEMGMPLRIGAITVQTAACSQISSGCSTTGISAWDGWSQLRRYLDAQPTTKGFKVGAPMDIRWGWANGFVIPPETTTTTTTTTSSTLAPTTTTVAPTTTTTIPITTTT